MWDCVVQDFYAHILLNALSFEFFAFKYCYSEVLSYSRDVQHASKQLLNSTLFATIVSVNYTKKKVNSFIFDEHDFVLYIKKV